MLFRIIRRQGFQLASRTIKPEPGAMATTSAAGFLRQLNQLLQTQQPIMGDQWGSLLQAQSEVAIRQIRQSHMTVEDGTEICRLIEQGLRTAEQKMSLGAAVSQTLAGNTEAKGKNKKKNQEMLCFWGFLTAEDRAIFSGDGPLVLRLTHAAHVMSRMELYWPSEQAVGHVVKTLQAAQKQGLESSDDFHGAVVTLKKKIKSMLKGASCGEFVSKFTRPEDLPPHTRGHFAHALGGELQGTVVLASDALRGSNKSLSYHKSNTAMLQAHPAAHPGMHMPNTMQGMMQFIGMAANMFNQQQQTSAKNDGVPGLKIFGGPAAATSSASSPAQQQASQLQIAQNNGPAEGTGTKQPEQAGLKTGQDPISPAQQAEQMLGAWTKAKDGEESDEPDAKNVSKPKAKAKCKAKAKAQCKAKAKAQGKAKAKAQPKVQPKKPALKKPAAVSGLTWSQRLKLRPAGCSKCRDKPGCTPSCLRKLGY